MRGGRCGRWLLIVDNADNPDVLSQPKSSGQGAQEADVDGGRAQPITAYLPQSQNGSILVTSRSRAVASLLVEAKDIVDVQPMAQDQALSLFEKKLGPLRQGENIAELAVALDSIPLAIVQAAAYVYQRAPRYSVEQYLEDLRKSD